MRSTVLVLLAAVVSTSALKVSQSNAADIELHEEKQQPGKKIFCFAAVQSNPEPTIDPVREQLKACDGYSFFSNFTDAKKDIFKATDRPTTTDSASFGFQSGGAEGATNRDILRDVWDHVADNKPGFDFYVKIDPDTFLRPNKLRNILNNYDQNWNMVLSDDMDNKPTGVLGSLYVLSKGAVDVYKQKRQQCVDKVWTAFEDQYMEMCMKQLEAKIEHPNNGFTNTPTWGGQGGTSNFLMSRETAYWAEAQEQDVQNWVAGNPFCIQDFVQDFLHPNGQRAGRKKCFGTDIAAIHPVKDAGKMWMMYTYMGEGVGKPVPSFLQKTSETHPNRR